VIISFLSLRLPCTKNVSVVFHYQVSYNIATIITLNSGKTLMDKWFFVSEVVQQKKEFDTWRE
jgi:hypothetical protein